MSKMGWKSAIFEVINKTTDGNTVNVGTRLKAFHWFYIGMTKPKSPELTSSHVQINSWQKLDQALSLEGAPI